MSAVCALPKPKAASPPPRLPSSTVAATRYTGCKDTSGWNGASRPVSRGKMPCKEDFLTHFF